jgi:hypothetical protein
MAAQTVEIADTVREGKKVRVSQKDGITAERGDMVDPNIALDAPCGFCVWKRDRCCAWRTVGPFANTRAEEASAAERPDLAGQLPGSI